MIKLKNLKKPLALLSAGIVLFTTACGHSGTGTAGGSNTEDATGSSTGSEAKGRYVETSVIPEGLSTADGIYKLDDGSYMIKNEEQESMVTSNDDGATWGSIENNVFYSSLPQDAEITGFCAYGDGTIFTTYIDWNTDATGGDEDQKIVNHFLVLKPDGSKQEGELICENQSRYLQGCVESQGRFFVMDIGGTVYEVNAEESTMNSIMEPDAGNYMDFFACGNYLIGVFDNVPYIYDLTNNKLMETDAALSDFLSENLSAESGNYSLFIAPADEGDTVYVACSKGLYRHVIGGTVMEQLIDGGLSSLGDPTKSVEGLQTKADGNFLMLYSDGMVCSYDYNADIPSVPETEIKVYSLYENSTIRQAITAYQKDHMDIFMNYEIGMTGSSGMTETDAIKNLNTEMVAGEGPDIILLDRLPMDSYIEKGLLVDLSDTEAEIVKSDSFFENILNSYQTKDGTYAMPIRFNLPIIAGKTNLTTNINNLSDLKKALESEQISVGSTLLGTYRADELLELLYMTVSPELLAADGSVDQEKLKEFLTVASSINELEQKNITDTMRTEYDARMQEVYSYYEGESTQSKMAAVLNAGYQPLDVIGESRAACYGELPGDTMNIAMVSSMVLTLQDAGITSFPGLGTTGQVFVPDGIVGISSKSEYQEQSTEFLKLLYSLDVQQVIDMNAGFPVNQTAFEKNLEGAKDYGFSMGSSTPDGRSAYLDVSGISDETIATLTQMAQTVSVPSNTNTIIHDAIIENGSSVLDGDKSVEEGVNLIMQKVGIYAQE